MYYHIPKDAESETISLNRVAKNWFFVVAQKLNGKFRVKTFAHILTCLKKILEIWLSENVTKYSKVKYDVL